MGILSDRAGVASKEPIASPPAEAPFKDRSLFGDYINKIPLLGEGFKAAQENFLQPMADDLRSIVEKGTGWLNQPITHFPSNTDAYGRHQPDLQIPYIQPASVSTGPPTTVDQLSTPMDVGSPFTTAPTGQPINAPITELHGPSIKTFPVSPGVALNTLYGIPGLTVNAAADTAAEFIAQNIENARQGALLTAAGHALRDVGAYPAIQSFMQDKVDPFLQNKVAPAIGGLQSDSTIPGIGPAAQLTFRGGFGQEARDVFAQHELANNLSGIESEDMSKSLGLDKKPGKPGTYTPQEGDFIQALARQPGWRDQLRGRANISFPINIRDHSISVPGNIPDIGVGLDAGIPGEVPGTQLRDQGYTSADIPTVPDIPELSGNHNIGDYVDKADEIAKAHGWSADRLIEEDKITPGTVARFAAGSWTPVAYAQNKIGVQPNTSSLRKTIDALTYREDYTPSERQAMGVIDNVGIQPIKYLQQQRVANATKLYNMLAAETDAVHPMSDSIHPELSPWLRVNTPEGVYTRMPTDELYGDLSGKLVKAPIAQEIRGYSQAAQNSLPLARALMGLWRWDATVGNTSTHAHIFVAHALMEDQAARNAAKIMGYDGSTGLGNLENLWTANSQFMKGGNYWQEAKEGGAPFALKGSIMQDVFDDTYRNAPGVGDGLHATLVQVAKDLTSKPGLKQASDLFSQNHSFWQFKLYTDLREMGMPINDAILTADQGVINYSHSTPAVKMVRSNLAGIPFTTFVYNELPNIVQGAINDPITYMRWQLAANTWNALADHHANTTQTEVDDINKEFPGHIVLHSPYRDFNGMVNANHATGDIFDTSMKVRFADKFTPVGEYIPGQRGVVDFSSMGLKGIALGEMQNLLMKIPLLSLGSGLVTGVDPGSGQKFSEPLMDILKEAAAAARVGEPKDAINLLSQPRFQLATDAYVQFLERSFLPGQALLIQRLGRALHGPSNPLQQPLDFTDVGLSAIGLGEPKTLEMQKFRDAQTAGRFNAKGSRSLREIAMENALQ